MLYAIIIVGGGPAGLTAAIYARRAEKSVLVLEAAAFGGQISYTDNIENYPGISSVSGADFATALYSQAKSCGADMKIESVSAVKDGKVKTVISSKGGYSCKSVIIASGQKSRRLGADGEQRYIGSGVSFCAVCDGAFFRDQTVAVLGGGNSALQEAILLSDGCKKVYIIQKFSYFTGEARLVAKLKERDNVEFIPSTVITALHGDKALTGLRLKSHDGVESELKVDGLFIAIGLVPENTAFADVADINEYGYFDSDESCLTHTPGIFAAGDCRSKLIRQITTAVADGSVAALAACRYIDNM